MPPTWKLRDLDRDAIHTLTRSQDLTELVAALLVARGHRDPEEAQRHLEASPMGLHDPFLLPDMEAACERLARALKDGETILVHGDYDVDGVTGTSLLMRIFSELGGSAVWHIPNRLVDGYSFGDHSIARAEATGAEVVVSVDNGTSAHGVIASLKERGIDTIVTDHHEAAPGPLPEAIAIVNPKLATSTYPWRELCGGAVAFKLAWGLAQKVHGKKKVSGELKRFLEEATAYVAIATVCDVVPLLDENRVFARFGLKALAQAEAPGLAALRDVAGLGANPTAEDVAFQIGPRINASGRLGSAAQAVELLLAKDAVNARRLAKNLDELNQRRREIEKEVLVQARSAAREFEDQDRYPVLVLAGQGWHQGVVGIVAARLTEEFHRPSVVIGLDGEEGRGSARSVDCFSVLGAISGADEHLMRWGGHEQAAGLEIRADKVDAAREAICAKAKEMLKEGLPEPELLIDFEIPFGSMTPDTMRQIERLEPFGAANEKPVLLSRGVRLAEPARAVGQEGAHLMVQLRHGSNVLKAMAFRQGPRSRELGMGMPLDVVYSPRWNTFRGRTNLELQLHDFRPGKE